MTPCPATPAMSCQKRARAHPKIKSGNHTRVARRFGPDRANSSNQGRTRAPAQLHTNGRLRSASPPMFLRTSAMDWRFRGCSKRNSFCHLGEKAVRGKRDVRAGRLRHTRV